MFKTEFLAAVGIRPEISERNAEQVITYCNSIDWKQELRNFDMAYNSSGPETVDYNDYWYLQIVNLENQSEVLIFTSLDRGLNPEDPAFVVTYSWYDLQPTGWFERIFSGKQEKKVLKARHLPDADHNILTDSIRCFVKNDIIRLKSIINYEGDSFDEI